MWIIIIATGFVLLKLKHKAANFPSFHLILGIQIHFSLYHIYHDRNIIALIIYKEIFFYCCCYFCFVIINFY